MLFLSGSSMATEKKETGDGTMSLLLAVTLPPESFHA
jgi:hypothetical protein